MFIKNYGAVTTGSSVGEAFVRMYYLEKICRIQMNLMQAGVHA